MAILPKPTPGNRTEEYLYKLATGQGSVQNPVSHTDMYLDEIIKNGGVGTGGGGGSNVTVNGEPQTNIDFIRREVVQDGLVDIPNLLDTGDSYSISFKFGIIKFGDSILECATFGASKSGWYFVADPSAKILFKFFTPTGTTSIEITKAYIGGVYDIDFVKNGNTIIIILDGNSISIDVSDMINNKNTVKWYSTIATFYSKLFYNRPLTPQEIQHNFQVLNNSPSINGLTTTDADGVKTSLLLSSNSELVTTRAGHNVEEELDGFRKLMAKSFVMDAQGKIIVANAMEKSKVLGLEIKGQTVKNLYKRAGTNIDPLRISFYTNKERVLGLYFCNTTDKPVTISLGALQTSAWVKDLKVSPKSTIAITDDLLLTTVTLFISEGWTQELAMLVRDDFALIDKNVVLSNPIPFGLSSTVASINCNGQSYPIYEPTIQGKTEILRALKGTQNWEVISASSERDATRYDYKLSSLEPSVEGLPSLGSVPSVSDYIDRASGVSYGNTKEIVLDGTQSILLQRVKDGLNMFRVVFEGNIRETSKANATASIYKSISANDTWNNNIPNSVSLVSNSNGVDIIVSASIHPSVDSFRQYLQANPVTVRYQLATPTQTQLTEEQLKAYNRHKKVILLSKVGDVADKLELKEDGSGVWNKNRDTIKLPKSGWFIDNGIPMPDTDIMFGRVTSDLVKSSLDTNKKQIECLTLNAISRAEMGNTSSSFEGIAINSYPHIMIRLKKSNLISPDVNGLIDYLNKINILINIPVATPTITHIDKSLVPTIPVDKINNLSLSSSVAPSSFKVTAPVTNPTETYLLSILNGNTVSGGSIAPQVSYSKITGLVNITGRIQISNANAVLFILPEICRPTKDVMVGDFMIYANGNVMCNPSFSNVFKDLAITYTKEMI